VTDPNADAGSIVYVSGDTNSDSKLDVNETWTYTAAHTLTQTEIDNNSGSERHINPITTHAPNATSTYTDKATIPLARRASLYIANEADAGKPADVAGESLTYTITVDNSCPTRRSSDLVTDPNADAGSIVYVSGDTNSDSKLDVNETWTYTAAHTLTQTEIDN